MATNFPSSLDSFATVVDNVDDVLASHINNPSDAVEALEAKIGVNNSAISSSHDYKLRNLPNQDGITTITNLNADLLDGKNSSDLTAQASQASNSTTITTTSTSFENLSQTQIIMTTGANPVLIVFSGTFYKDTAGTHVYIVINIDGTGKGGSTRIVYYAAGGTQKNIATSWLETVTAASHTFTIQWCVDVGTGYAKERTIQVIELKQG